MVMLALNVDVDDDGEERCLFYFCMSDGCLEIRCLGIGSSLSLMILHYFLEVYLH